MYDVHPFYPVFTRFRMFFSLAKTVRLGKFYASELGLSVVGPAGFEPTTKGL